jgi:hypothetical protein
MAVRQGYADCSNARDAIVSLREQIWQSDIELVVFFASPDYSRSEIEQAVGIEFPGIKVIGCTTAGEITYDGYKEGTIAGISFGKEHFRTDTVLVPSLRSFSMEDGGRLTQKVLEGLGLNIPSAKSVPTQTFAMLLVDGMSNQEEVVVSSLNRFLDPIPLFGGSAGDGLRQHMGFCQWRISSGCCHSSGVSYDLPVQGFQN